MSDNQSTSNKPSPASLWAALLTVYIIWGSTYLGMRFAIETIPPFIMAGFRFLAAGVILYAVMRLRGAARPQPVHWRSTLIIGVLLVGGGPGLVGWSEQFIPSGLAALVIATVPMWIVLLDWLYSGHKNPGWQVIAGLLIGFIGLILLIDPFNFSGAEQGQTISLIGVGGLLMAAFLWSNGSLYSRKAPLPDSPLLGTSMEMMLGGAFLLIISLIAGDWRGFDPAGVSMRSMLALLYLITFGSLVAFSAYIWLIRVTTPARATSYAYVNPIIAVILGWLLADEMMNGRMIIATTIIVGAVVLITTQKEPQEEAEKLTIEDKSQATIAPGK